ncbi:M3 family oligoendopeptidase, partial [Neobacillus niacini]
MRFEEYTYNRPNLDEVKARFETAIKKFTNASSLEEQSLAMNEVNEIRNDIGTMFNLCYIRHSVDTNDEFYKAEQDYMDEVQPEIEGLVTKYYQALVNSKYRNDLEAKYGKQLFALAEGQLKTFKPEIVPLLQKENRLSTEYTKLIASAKINFEG